MKKHISTIAILFLGVAMIASPSLSFAQTKDNGQGNNNGNHYAYGHVDAGLAPGNSAFGHSHNNPPVPPANVNATRTEASTSLFGQLYGNFSSWFNYLRNGNHSYASTSSNWNKGGSDNDGDSDDSGSSASTTSTTTVPANIPPVINGVSSPTVLGVGQTGTWTVSASDPQNGNLSYMVNWGDQGIVPLLMSAMIQPPFVQTSTFTHSYSRPGVYTVTFTVKDSAGLTTTSSITVNVVTSTSGPVISNVNATSTTLHYATLTWNTNENSDSEVWYSTTSPVDTSAAPSVTHPALVFDHKVVLNGLASGTTYYAVVGSKDSRGNLSTSSETSFTTKAPVDANPVITSLTGTSTITAGVQGTWSVNAYDPRNEPLTYNVNWGDTGGIMNALFAAFSQPVYLQSSTFTHTYANPGTYTITVTAKNSSGLTTTATTSVDVTAVVSAVTIPVVSNVNAVAASTTATVSWNTDQSSDSTVYYSTTTPVVIGADSTDSVTDSTSATTHDLDVGNLATSTTYYFVVQSSDSAGTATSSESSFATTVE